MSILMIPQPDDWQADYSGQYANLPYKVEGGEVNFPLI